MKVTRVLVAALALCLTRVGPAGGAIGEPEPGSNPKTEGPIAIENSRCSNQTVRSDSDDTVLGHAEYCLFLYKFDTLSEVDVLREYGAVWLQARFDPAEGWCATDVATKVLVSGGRSEAITKAPRAGGKVATKLRLDAGGNALQEATISQKWVPRPVLSPPNRRRAHPGRRARGRATRPRPSVSSAASATPTRC
jgi:hypothetical protein